MATGNKNFRRQQKSGRRWEITDSTADLLRHLKNNNKSGPKVAWFQWKNCSVKTSAYFSKYVNCKYSTDWRNRQLSDWCKISADDVLIGYVTLAGDLGGITIWNPWSNKSDANLEDSACTVQVLLFFPILLAEQLK